MGVLQKHEIIRSLKLRRLQLHEDRNYKQPEQGTASYIEPFTLLCFYDETKITHTTHYDKIDAFYAR